MTTTSETPRKFGLFSYENSLLLILSLTWGFVFFDRQAMNFLAPYVVKELSLSNTQVGLLSSGLAGTWAFSAYLIGRWSDSKGLRKPFLLAFTLIFSVCSILSGLAPNFAILLLSRVIMGIAEGPFLPVCLAIMMVESTPRRRGFNAGFMQTFFSTTLASVAAPIVLVVLADALGWRAAFFIAGVPGLLCLVAIWLWVREPVKVRPTAADVAEDSDANMGLFQMLRVRNIWLCCLMSICMVTMLVVSTTFLPLFFTEVKGIRSADWAWILSIAGIAGPIAFLVPLLSDRLGRKPVLIAVSYLTLLGPLAALYFEGPKLVLAGLMLLGNFGAGTFPLVSGIIPSETIPRKYAATAMGLIVGVGEIAGGFFAPTLAGVLADNSRAGLAVPILITAGCSLICGTLALFIKETAPAKLARAAAKPAASPV